MVGQRVCCSRVAYCLRFVAQTSFALTLWLTCACTPTALYSRYEGHQYDQTTIDMAPSSTAKPKKEKVFHPSSRKAGQLARNALRKGKLGNLSAKRSQKNHSLGLLILNFSILSKFLNFFFIASRSLWIFLPCNARRRVIVAARSAPHHQRHLVNSV